mgnify:FL=1|tara:strand:+ start:3972 stop:4787 length:816 start_codon:yes stop_codon:yes gene_type:complete
MSEETPQVDNVEQVASEDWRSTIPEDIQNDPSLADIQDVASLAKGYVHAQHMIGSDKVAIPSREASQEELDVFYNKLGRPESADGYEAPTENMPEIPHDNEMQTRFFEEAHRIGLNKQQAGALIRWQAEQAQTGIEANSQATESAMQQAQDSMRQEFGKAYEEKMNMAKNAALEFGGEDLMKVLDSSGLGNDPAIIKAFANIGKAIMNDEIVGGGGRQGFMMSPAEAKSQIANMKRDPNFLASYQDQGHIAHKESVAEMAKLYELAYPSNE